MPSIIPVRRNALHRAPTSTFTPASLTGLIAWYSADFGVFKDAGITPAANTDTVQQWNDRSGNGYHLSQATAGIRPTFNSAGFNAKQTITFSVTVGTRLQTAATDVVAMGTGTAGSAFIVGQMLTGTGNFGRAISYATGATGDFAAPGMAAWIVRDGTANGFATFRNNVELAAAAISLATNYRLGMIYDGANVTPYINNVAQTSAAQTDAWASPGTICIGFPVNSTGAWDGPLSEIVITNSALSSSDRTSLDNYFKTKWGL